MSATSAENTVLEALKHYPFKGRRSTTEQIYEACKNLKITTFIRTLSKLKKQGKIKGDGSGNFWYQLEDTTSAKLDSFMPRYPRSRRPRVKKPLSSAKPVPTFGEHGVC